MIKFKCPYCGQIHNSPNGTGSDVSCCGEIGHSEEIIWCPRCDDEWAGSACRDLQCPSESEVTK